ncbi:MAG: putative ABC transport system permease protein [Gammaproteobacteria bacterium]|jgi:putative ABC transport system permease protein
MHEITLFDLAIGFIPVFVTLLIIFYWENTARSALIAIIRMLTQLLLIGYVLNFIFTSKSQWVILLILVFMLCTASWIALNALPVNRWRLFGLSFVAIFVGGVFNLALITQGVLHVEPWYQPVIIIPLAGMIFSNSMNTLSLAGERFYSELGHQPDPLRARNIAFQAAMIPITNSLLAVGLVSLPGMMTGQILAGTSPLIAARYQIMVMCMIFSSSGISAALFLWLLKRQLSAQQADAR